jgi:hypothetical protein
MRPGSVLSVDMRQAYQHVRDQADEDWRNSRAAAKTQEMKFPVKEASDKLFRRFKGIAIFAFIWLLVLLVFFDDFSAGSLGFIAVLWCIPVYNLILWAVGIDRIHVRYHHRKWRGGPHG